MTPEQFVVDLREDVRQAVDGMIDSIARTRPDGAFGQLASFAAWYGGLSEEDRAVAGMAMRYAAEGALFGLLTLLDGLYDLPSGTGGQLELHYAEGGERVRLNDPEGDLLHQVFNNTDETN